MRGQQLEDHEQPPVEKKIRQNVAGEYKTPTEALKNKFRMQQSEPLPDNKIYAISNDKKRVLIRQKKTPSLKIGDMSDMVCEAVDRVHKKLRGQGIDDDYDANDEEKEILKQMVQQELLLIQQKNKISNNNIYNNARIEHEKNQYSSDGSED
jgi:hypothetical protein